MVIYRVKSLPRIIIVALTAWSITLPALGGNKLEGTTTLKDFQPYGTKDKEHKHQGYDLSFQTADKSYTCRTDPKNSMKATDFVVGTEVKYKVDNNKAKIKSPDGKEIQCKIVRVEALGSLVGRPGAGRDISPLPSTIRAPRSMDIHPIGSRVPFGQGYLPEAKRFPVCGPPCREGARQRSGPLPFFECRLILLLQLPSFFTIERLTHISTNANFVGLLPPN
jgi:hypothetical protein